jgi:hypothetical protein
MEYEGITGVIIQIGGADAILIEDSVASNDALDMPVLLAQGNETHPALWVDEQRVVTLRERHPGLPIYGLWQTLYHNDIVTKDKLQIVLIGEKSGHYLLQDEVTEQTDPGAVWRGQYIESGEYLGDRIANHFHLKPSTDGHRLDFDLSELSAPPISARLMSEIVAERSASVRRMWVSRAIAAILACAIVGATHYFRVMQIAAAEERISALQRELADVQSQAQAILASRIAEWPSPLDAVSPYLVVSAVDSNFTFPDGVQEVSLRSRAGSVRVQRDASVSALPTDMGVRRLPNGLWEVSWDEK